MGRKDKLVQDDDGLPIGARMRLARQRRNLSLKDMAEKLTYSVPHLSTIENGRRKPTAELVKIYEQQLELESGELLDFLVESEKEALPVSSENALEETQVEIDWGEVPDILNFYGREKELERLSGLVDRYRIVAIVGIGGVGKTSLAAQLAHQTGQFKYIFWCPLQNMHSLEYILKRCIASMSQHKQAGLPDNEDELILQFIGCLRKHRCLLILDNFETVLQESKRAGQYDDSHKGYGKLLKRVGESRHQSCLLLTSREKPGEVAYLEGSSALAAVLPLTGVGDQEARDILRDKGLKGTDADWSNLNKLYSGNPLALKLVSASIRETFDGHIGKFLSQGATVFGDIYDLLNQQIRRLSPPEREILYWLAIEQEAVSLQDVRDNIVRPIPGSVLLEAIDSLKRRSLIMTVETDRFSLHPVVKEYITNDFIKQLVRELIEKPVEIFDQDPFFDHYPLMKARSRDHIRNAQKRLILAPLAESLLAAFGQEESERKLKEIVLRLQQTRKSNGYAAGNVLNLLLYLQTNLRGYDFSQLVVREAYLRGVTLPDVSFSGADLSTAVFTETFGTILSIAIDHEEQLLAVGTDVGEIRLWHFASRTAAFTLQGHTNWVWSVAFSPDGQLLASGSDDRTVRLWDVNTGECLKILGKHLARVRSVAFSPDGRLLASGSEDGTVRLWDVQARMLADSFAGGGDVYAIAFSPDGRLLAGGGEDGIVRLWDVQTKQLADPLKGMGGHIYALAFLPGEPILASGGEDGNVWLWDVNTGRCLSFLHGHNDQIYTLAFHPAKRLLVSGNRDGAVVLWDIHTGQRKNVLKEHSNRVNSLVFSPGGKVLASGSNDQTVKLWNINTGQCLDTLQGYTNLIWSVTFSPDGRLLASGSNDYAVRLWDVEKKQCLRVLEGHLDRVRAVAFHPDGRLLASGAEDRTVRLWDVETSQCLRVLEGHLDRVRAVAFHPDGQLLASGGEDEQVILWKARVGQRITTFIGGGGQVYAVAFSPNGQILASGSEDGRVRLWDAEKYFCKNSLEGHEDKIYAVAFSPDGTLLASGSNDQTVKLWDMETGRLLATLTGHTNRVYSLAFSPDGRLLASGSNDQTVKLWRINADQRQTAFQCEATLRGEDIWVYSVAFHPLGHILASGSNKGTIELWDVREGEKQLPRPLKSERPYERMDITRAKGLSTSRHMMLRALGAIDKEPKASDQQS